MSFITQGKANLKYILIVVILAAIIGGGILAYYYLWIKDIETRLAVVEVKLPEKIAKGETADWKTYRNEEYGFEFKYPQGYSIEKETASLKIYSSETKKMLEAGTETPDYIIISPRVEEENLGLEIGLPRPIQSTEEYFLSEEIKKRSNITFIGKTTIDNRTGFQLLVMDMFSVKHTIFKNPDGTWFQISIIAHWGKIIPYDTILSTFKFLEEKPVACTQEAKICPDGSTVGRTGPNCEFAQCPDVKKNETANWKTYRDKKYGFEIKYPEKYVIKEAEVISGTEEDQPPEYLQGYLYGKPVFAEYSIEIYSLPYSEKNIEAKIFIYKANNLTVTDWIDYINNGVDKGFIYEGRYISNTKPISISGIEAIQGMSGCCLVCVPGIFIPKDSKIISINQMGSSGVSSSDCPGYNKKYNCCFTDSNLFDQMLSTFRVLD